MAQRCPSALKTQKDMERIKLNKDEKMVLLHLKEKGGKQPRNLSPLVFFYSLSTLQEKGLVKCRFNYDEVIDAKLSVKGKVYLEQNPKLKNPIDWKTFIIVISTAITAVATTVAIFVRCSFIHH